jgi:hypothetical protein
MGEWSLPQGGESPLPLPRELGGRCGHHRRGHRLTPTRRRLRGARHLSRRPPGGGRSHARPRRCLLCRPHGSGRGGRRLPPLGESPFPIAVLLLLVRRRVLRSRRGRRAPAALLCSRRSCHRILLSFLRAARSCSRRCATRAHARARGVGGSDRATFTAITCRERVKLRVRTTPHESTDQRGAEIHSPKGRRGA